MFEAEEKLTTSLAGFGYIFTALEVKYFVEAVQQSSPIR